MKVEHERLWRELQPLGLVEGPLSAPESASSPWYITLFMAFFGWLAALFLFVAVALLFFFDLGLDRFFDNPLALWAIGLVLIGAAFWLLRSAGSKFVRHLALAFSLAGQGFVAWGAFQGNDALGATLLFTAFQLLLAATLPDFIHRVFSTALAGLGFMVFVPWPGLNLIAGAAVLLFSAWAWLHEFHYPRLAPALRAWGYGSVLALIISRSDAVLGWNPLMWWDVQSAAPEFYRWLAPLMLGLAAIYPVYVVCRRLAAARHTWVLALCGVATLALLSADAPGLLVCAVVLVLGQAGSNPVLKGLGIVGLLFYISAFYYQLHLTLMLKAQILLATGLLLLATRWLMLRLVTSQTGGSP